MDRLRPFWDFDDLDGSERRLREQLERETSDSGRAEVLTLLAEGRTDRGIASSLYVTPKTVEAHVRSIFRKLDLPSDAMENRRVHAVITFLRAHSI